MVVAIKRAEVPITRAAIRAAGPGIAVINNNFDFKSRPRGGGFCFPDLVGAFTPKSVKTFIGTAIANLHFVAVLWRAAAGANKAGVRKISRSFTARRSYNSPS
jgi:hypothetical protein